MSAEQNVEDGHVWHKRRTFPPEAHAGHLEEHAPDPEGLGPREDSEYDLSQRSDGWTSPPCHRRTQKTIAQRPTWRTFGANLLPHVPHAPRLTPMLSHASSSVCNGDGSTWVF